MAMLLTRIDRLQDTAKQVLGRAPATYPDLYKQVGLFEPQSRRYEYLVQSKGYEGPAWNPDFGQEQWWFDALTVDPSKLISDLTGIWEHGKPQPVTSTKLENASIGTLPKVLVYIAVHQQFGTHIWFPYHGARHGSQDREAEGAMYEGFKYWHSDLDELELRTIVQNGYYMQPKGLDKFKLTVNDAQQLAFAHNSFDPNYFMVCVPGLPVFQHIGHPDQLHAFDP